MGEKGYTVSGLELKETFSVYDIGNLSVRASIQAGKGFLQFVGNQDSLYLVPPTLSRNLLFSGGIGSGKTNGIFQVVDQLLDKLLPGDTMIVFDSKGDFHEEFAGRSGVSCDCIACDAMSTVRWNMFREAVSDLPMNADVSEVDEALLELSMLVFGTMIEQDKTNPFFTQAAKNIFFGILKVLSEKYYIPTRNPSAVTNRMIDEFSRLSAEELAAEFMAPACVGTLGQFIDYLGRFNAKGDFEISNQGAGVLASMRNVLLNIFRGNFAKDGQFSVRDFIRKGGRRVLFVEYDIRRGSVLAPIYKTIMDFAIKEALGRHTGKRNVFFVIDEYRLLPKLEYMDAGVNFGRSLGVKFIVGIQNFLQIDEVYGKAMARSILSGFLTTVNFRTTDGETREYIKSLFGERIYTVDAISTTGGQTRERNDTVTDDDILRLEPGQAIVGIPALMPDPIRFQFMKYEDYLIEKKRRGGRI